MVMVRNKVNLAVSIDKLTDAKLNKFLSNTPGANKSAFVDKAINYYLTIRGGLKMALYKDKNGTIQNNE